MIDVTTPKTHPGMHSLDAFASEKLAQLDERRLRRDPPRTARAEGMWVDRQGRRLLSFSSNDYLHLSVHPAVRAAASAAIARDGSGSGASYLVTGNHPGYALLEARLAALKGTEAAIVFGSGFLANLGTIGALVGAGDVAFIDERAHASMWAGVRASAAAVHAFRHNDPHDLARLLRLHRAHARHALILTESVFSMDGDRAPLSALAEIADAADAWLMCDDAHALGVIGRGADSAACVPLQMGTLSKAVGSYGGYVCTSRAVVDFLKNRARTFVYSTALPPATIAASIAALEIIAHDAVLVARPLTLARRFAARLGIAEPASAIVPLVVGDAAAAIAAQAQLEARGFLVVAIRPPSVPDGSARLRLTFSAAHSERDVDALADAVRAIGCA